MAERSPAAAGPGELAALLREQSALLREQSARLAAAATAAHAVSYEAVEAGAGQAGVAVTVTGAGRVASVRIAPPAMRSSPAALALTLTRLLNEALRGVRERAARAVAGAAGLEWEAVQGDAALMPGEARQVISQLAGEVVRAGSAGQQVTVTASGRGDIVRVEITTAALAGTGAGRLGEQVAAAANDALGAAGQLRQRLAGPPPDPGELATMLGGRVAASGRAMDELLDQLGEVQRRMRDLRPPG